MHLKNVGKQKNVPRFAVRGKLLESEKGSERQSVCEREKERDKSWQVWYVSKSKNEREKV